MAHGNLADAGPVWHARLFTPPPRTRHRLQQEIRPHLADPEVGELTIIVKVDATRRDGFPQRQDPHPHRNARVLKF
jgi:hypothetical protein